MVRVVYEVSDSVAVVAETETCVVVNVKVSVKVSVMVVGTLVV